jgi:DNA-directed RNA polymerase subunit RPC12/RpoP
MAAKIVPILTALEAKALWDNARDSILHTLEHFGDLSMRIGDRRHHEKQIVLSTHHAAETFCNMLLKRYEPQNTKLTRKGQDHYPSLPSSIVELVKLANPAGLTGAEIQLLEVFKSLHESRNRIMHGIVPEGLDISVAAMSILGLSRVTLRRKGICLEDILEGDPPIGHDVISAISWNRLDEYCRFVEAFLAEERPGQYFHKCENCGATAVVNNRCEACFESMDFFTCASCDEELVLPESFRLQNRGEIVCPSCGGQISV